VATLIEGEGWPQPEKAWLLRQLSPHNYLFFPFLKKKIEFFETSTYIL
jgi:hypothetical protein